MKLVRYVYGSLSQMVESKFQKAKDHQYSCIFYDSKQLTIVDFFFFTLDF